MKTSSTLFLTLALSSILSISCQKDNPISNEINYGLEPVENIDYSKNLRSQSQNEDLEVQNGILHFKSMEVFRNLRTKSVEELGVLIPAFNSFDSKINKFNRLNEEAQNLKSETAMKGLLSKYKTSAQLVVDQVKIADESIYDRFIPDISRPYFYVGNVIMVYKDGFQYSILDGDLQKVQKIFNGEKSIPSVGELPINPKNSKLREVNATCQNMDMSFTAYNNYRGISWAHSYAVGDPTGIVINGKKQYRMYVSSNTCGQVQRKIFGVWWNSDTDKTVYANHTVNAYLDGSQVINEYIDFSTTTYGTPQNQVFTDVESSPLIYLLEDELYRYTADLTEGNGRLSTSSLVIDVWYKCP